MNSLTSSQLLDTPLASTGADAQPRSLERFARSQRPDPLSTGQRAVGGAIAVTIQVLFIVGIAYGTMQGIAPQLENLTIVNVLDETPVVEELPPPPPPKMMETPILTMQMPEVTITPPEPPKNAPTAVVSDLPTPPPPRVDDGERLRQITDFQRALQRHLLRQLMYPAQARARKEEGVVYVRVAMSRAGQVVSAKIQDASDFPQLNQEALAVIQRAQPLPLPPPAVTGEPVDLIIPVTFNLRGGRGGGHRRGGNRD
jgi:protein TonB